MRLVVNYVEGDGCTYSCEHSLPVQYESAEALLIEIESRVKSWLALHYSKRCNLFDFTMDAGGTELYLDNFIEAGKFVAPNIYTIDEWFAANGVK